MFTDFITNMINSLSELLYSHILIILLLGAGIFFTIKTKFVQIRMFIESLRVVAQPGSDKNGLSSFQALMVSTASRVGTGNIAGISTAICLGGSGAVFWMWLTAILGSASAFIESTLAQIYKHKAKDGSSYGGPAYYIQAALKKRWIGVLFAVVLILTYMGGFNLVASFNIADSFRVYSFFNPEWTPLIVGAILAVVFALAVFGGSKKISQITEVLVPIMGIFYLAVSLFIILKHYQLVPVMFTSIFNNAFDVQAIFGGFAGSCVMHGIKRGLFSNEAGEGSVPNAAATADADHPVVQGLIQSFGVYVDTLFICSASAFIILLSGDYTTTNLTGIELVQWNLSQYFGSIAPSAVAILIFLFAFSSIVGNYYYGEINISHLTKKKWPLNLYRGLVGVMVYFGSIADLPLVWNLADLFMAFQVLTNVTAILILFPRVKEALDDYETQQANGVASPKFVKNVLKNTTGVVWWQN